MQTSAPFAAIEDADWVVVPTTAAEIAEVADRCRRKVTKRALLAAGVAVVPVPGLDWLTDVGVLLKLLPEINAAFGLTEAQIQRLTPQRRVMVYKLISAAGGFVAGRLAIHELVVTLLRKVGVRLGAQQAAKFVPLAGQALSALITFSAVKYVCEQHIRQCVQVAEQLQVPEAQPLDAAAR